MERAAALCFLSEVWGTRSEAIQEKREISEQVLRLIKKGCRSYNKPLRYASLTYMFRLLDLFSIERNNYAPIFYKTLTFLLVEHHSDKDT